MAKKARLLCLQQSSLFESYGGAEYYVDDLLTAASHLLTGPNVRTLVPQRTPHFKIEKRPYSVEVIQFKRTGFLRKLENRYSWDFFWSAYANIREFNPTFLLCSHVNLSPMAFALSKLTGIPYFVIALGIETWGDLLPQDEFALKRAAGVVSISEWTKKVLVQRGFEAEKIYVVHPTLNEFFEKIPLTERPVNSVSPLRLLTISRLSDSEQYKGQDHVLQALHQIRQAHPEWKIHYTIQGEGADKARLEALVKELHLEDWVEFKPSVRDRNELTKIYEQSDLFVMPSRFGKWGGKWRGEGFGIVYVEAGVLGVPSIAYDCGGATDIIQSEKNGLLVEQDNIEALSNAIGRFYQNRELLVSMGKVAHHTAKERFSPTSMANQLNQFFRLTYENT